MACPAWSVSWPRSTYLDRPLRESDRKKQIPFRAVWGPKALHYPLAHGGGLRSVADDKPAFTPTRRDLEAWQYAFIKNAEANLDKELKATLMQAPKEGLRTMNCTGLKSERRAWEE